MSYPPVNSDDFLPDLIRRKEIFSLKNDPKHNFRDPGPDAPGLRLRSYQIFAKTIINPNTPYTRFHLKHATGSGKSLSGVAVGNEFIQVYKKLKTKTGSMGPMVFVLGFGGTKAAFIRELLEYPEFGFITVNEKAELAKRKIMSGSGLPDDIKYYRDYYTSLKKRITNKNRGGFYKFYGYDEFVNRLFIGSEVKLIDIESDYRSRKKHSDVTLWEVFEEYLANGKLQVSTQMLESLENSLLIADEVHNTYNMETKNNRGIAIQWLLDTCNLRFLSLSATPTNNSPSEIVELVNYWLPKDKRITKKEFFINSRTLYPGKLEELGKLSVGHISFLQDVDLRYYPLRVFVGKDLILPADVGNWKAGEAIPYFKFIDCPMSEFHQRTYNWHIENSTNDDESNEINDSKLLISPDEEEQTGGESVVTGSYHSIPTDGYSIYDLSLPNPINDIGLFRSSEIRSLIPNASKEWKEKNLIDLKRSVSGYVIVGDFLQYSNIGKYSTKYKTLLELITEIIGESGGDPNKCQKIMIYHDRKIMSGAIFIQELLKANNMLDEYSEPTDNTICAVCGKSMEEHTTSSQHEFYPVRFVFAHSDIEKAVMEQSLAKYNSAENRHGLRFMILIGSKIIKESYNFIDIQNLIIVTLPINIPTLIQVFGRCVRTNSHINLPPDQRKVKIRMLVSTTNKNVPTADPISPEMYRYIDKLSDYMVIQDIEREFNKRALDADIHRDIIMPQELKAQYFPAGKPGPVAMLGNLYFDPVYTSPDYQLSDLNLSTYTAYGYYNEEIKVISYIIKRLFMLQPVWTYDSLWDSVRKPPFGIEINPALFSEGNFIIVLSGMVNDARAIYGDSTAAAINQLVDYTEKNVYLNGVKHKIEHIGEYYIMFPISPINNNKLNTIYSDGMENMRDKERAMIKKYTHYGNPRPLIDVETYIRGIKNRPQMNIGVDAFIRDSKTDSSYIEKKSLLISNDLNGKYSFISDFSSNFQIRFTEEAIVWSIEESFDITTDDPIDTYRNVLAMLDSLGAIIKLGEVAKYKDTAKHYDQGLPDVNINTPLGYMIGRIIRLYNPASGKWIEVNKTAMNRHTVYKENDIIIGYLESASDHMKFKLRKPVQKIKSTNDIRTIEKGIVCETKNKNILLEIIASLGVSVSKLDKTDSRVKKLCEIIKQRLIELEIKERCKGSQMKWLYSWWNERIDLSLL